VKEVVKVMVIGIDDASWNVIEPWIRKGKLPTIRKLMENGVYGDLRSCIHFFTSPAWKCYSTGRNPGKLGALTYWNFDRTTKRLAPVSSTYFKGEELWDILGEYGCKCGVANMPLTFPPREINGILICGFLSPEKGFTYPPKIEKELRKYNYRVNPKFNMAIHTKRALSELKALIESRFSIGKRLLDEFEFDFFQLVIYYIDEIQHFFSKYTEEKDSIYRDVIEKFWRLIDSGIEELLKSVGKNCYTFIISDHGATSLKGVFRLNIWLKLKGYLHLRRRAVTGNILDPTKVEFMFNENFPLRFIADTTRRLLPERMLGRIKQPFLKEKTANVVFQQVDWNKTKAIGVSQNCIFITRKNDSNLRDEIKENLRNVRDPKSGEKIVENVYTNEEVFKGPYVDLLPDLIIKPKEGYLLRSIPLSGNKKDLWDFSRKHWSSCHKLHGVFLANGPSIKKGNMIDAVSIYDLAPTILHIFGVSVPDTLDGRVLTEIFEENSQLARKPVKYEKRMKKEKERRHYSRDEERAIIERLRNLGYL